MTLEAGAALKPESSLHIGPIDLSHVTSSPSTPMLYDKGEENWGIKLHLGCGGVYLQGYVNVDIVDDLTENTDPGPNRTDIRDYYAGLQGTATNLPTRRRTIADARYNFIDPPYKPGTVDKIVCVQAFEHLTAADADTALNKWWTILKPGGVLILSVPDMNGTLEWLKHLETAFFAYRHLRGSMRDAYNRHNQWFTPHNLVWTLKNYGYGQIEELPNFHFYPAIVIRAHKEDLYVPDRRYQNPLPGYDEAICKTVLDVGPGKFPLPFATQCLDVDDTYRAFRTVPSDIGTVEALPYADGAFDYAYSSHCLEHVEHPAQALAELQRVGKRGFVEVPTMALDFLMQHGANQALHGRWMCLQGENRIVFVEKPERMQPAFIDRTWGKYFHRVTQYNIPLSSPERYMRYYFWKRQNILNASVSWNPDRVAKATEVRKDGSIYECDGHRVSKIL